jgi:Polyketide cyclase / dehydrase and lipid transport
MLKKVLLSVATIVAVLVIGFVVVVAMQPSEFHVERSATMDAPAETVFAQINDFHKWDAWSPWLNIDPAAKTSYEGPSAGEGAVFRWAGNADVGEGSMTIVESRPNERVRINLHFIKPFEDTAPTEFVLKGDGNQTTVTWTMDGKNNFLSKVFCLFMSMDKMIGSKYEEGLANMKAIVETAPTEPSSEAPDNQRSEKPIDQPAEPSSGTPGQET